MWKSCFTENQIVAMLRARGWDEAADVCRKHRVSEATQYKRKARWRLPVLGAAGYGALEAEKETAGGGDAGQCGAERHLFGKVLKPPRRQGAVLHVV